MKRERLDVRRGEPLRKAWAFRDTTTGLPADLSGVTPRFTVRRYTDSPEITLEEFGVAGSTVLTVDLTAGKITLTVPPEVTAGWLWQRAVYDLDLTPDGGSPNTIRAGEIIVSGEVGR